MRVSWLSVVEQAELALSTPPKMATKLEKKGETPLTVYELVQLLLLEHGHVDEVGAS